MTYNLQAEGKTEVQYSDCKENEPSSNDEEGTASKLEEKGKYSLQTRFDGDAISRLEARCTASRLEMSVHSLEAIDEGCTAARLEVREVQQQTRCVADPATRLDAREAQPSLGKARCKGVATSQARVVGGTRPEMLGR